MANTNATALVRLELEVSLMQPWPAEATLDQVMEQAEKEARSKLEVLIQRHPMLYRVVPGSFRVTAVLARQGQGDAG